MSFVCLIDQVDRTDDTDLENFKIENTIGDRIPTIEIDMIDNPAYPLSIISEVLLIDIGPDALANPTINLLLNPLFTLGTGGLGSYTKTIQTGGTVSNGPTPIVTITNASLDGTSTPFHNFTGFSQVVPIVPGQTYCLSARLVSGNLIGGTTTMKLGFFNDGQDVNNTNMGATFISANTTTRATFTATAPNDATKALILIGTVLTNATNSGSLAIQSAQFESTVLSKRGVHYPTPDCNVNENDCLVLPDGTACRQTRVFAGIIIDTTPDPDRIGYPMGNQGGSPRPIVTIGCRGTAYLLESKFVSGVFSGVDSDLIIAAVNSLLPNQIDTSNVVPGITVDARVSDDETLLEFITGFTDTSGFIHYVDNYFRLHVEPLGYTAPSFELSDQPDNVSSFGYFDWVNAIDGTQLGNRVTVHGGPFTATTEESFTANGSQKQFTLAQKQPREVISVTKGGVEQRKGILGNSKTTFTNYDVLVDFPNHTLNFASNLANTTVVTVQYVFDGQIKEQALDLQSIATYQRGNFDGIFDRKVNDTNITTSLAALQRATSELALYGSELAHPTFSCFQQLVPGQSVQVTCGQDNYFSKPFLVQKVTTTLLGNGNTQYDIECGADIPSFSRSFKRLHKAANRSKRLPGDAYTSVNLIAREGITYRGDSINVTQINQTSWVYNDAGSLYGYAAYTYTPPPPVTSGFTYGNPASTYGTARYYHV